MKSTFLLLSLILLSFHTFAEEWYEEVLSITKPAPDYVYADRAERKPASKKVTKTKKKTKIEKIKESTFLKRSRFMFGVGQNFLQGEQFKNHGSEEIGIDFYHLYKVNPKFELATNYHSNTFDNGSKDVTLSGINFGLKFNLLTDSHLTPYAIAGLGFYKPHVSSIDDSKFALGNHMGAGIDLRITKKIGVGALFHHHNPFDVKTSGGERIKGSYNKLMLTISFDF